MNETDTKEPMTPTTNTGELTITEAVEKLRDEQGLSVQAASDKLGIYFSAYYADRQRPVAQRRLLSSVKHHAHGPRHRAYSEDERRAFVERVHGYMAKHSVNAKVACHDCKLSYGIFRKHRAALGLSNQVSTHTGPVVFAKNGIVPIQNADGSWSAGCPKCAKDWTVPTVRRLAQDVSRHLVTVHGTRTNKRGPYAPPTTVPDDPFEAPDQALIASSLKPEPTNTDTFYCPHCGTHLSLDLKVNLKSVTAHRQ